MFRNNKDPLRRVPEEASWHLYLDLSDLHWSHFTQSTLHSAILRPPLQCNFTFHFPFTTNRTRPTPSQRTLSSSNSSPRLVWSSVRLSNEPVKFHANNAGHLARYFKSCLAGAPLTSASQAPCRCQTPPLNFTVLWNSDYSAVPLCSRAAASERWWRPIRALRHGSSHSKCGLFALFSAMHLRPIWLAPYIWEHCRPRTSLLIPPVPSHVVLANPAC